MPALTLGALVDPATHERRTDPVTIQTADLTTHGVIVGMTGSGKTGLGVVLIEEALGAGVPCLLIDPKGDLGNLCLMFPDLAPADFRPWVDEGLAKQAGVTPDEFAAQQASQWREGLASWSVAPERIAALRRDVRFTIYTPGSTSGVPVNIVGSLRAPSDMADLETVRDEVSGYVSGLLALVGIDADPLASKEHILLSNLIETSWAAGRDLDLPMLVAQVAQPPIRKLGVFDLDSFYPAAERTQLAMRLNGLIASPAFAAWAQGDPVDIASMLRAPDGRPGCSIVSIAHLSDDERQFVVSLLLAKLVTWMRKQSGTSDLRALLYMDEVAGYVPPTASPPTKKPIMLLMKQARAFGVGVVLSTQNPVDVDYKALSNAGTWMVGRLQTERDKARLLDGMTAAAGTVDVTAVGNTISGLAKREFVLKRAGKDQPDVFTTRWAMSYLRGPLTRDQIAALTAASPRPAASASPAPTSPLLATPPAAASTPPPASTLAADETPVLPPVADGIPVRWMDAAAPWASQVGADASSSRYRPAAVGRMQLRYDDTRAGVHHDDEFEVVLFPLAETIDATAGIAVDYDDRDLRAEQPADAVYVLSAAKLKNKTYWTTLQRSLVEHVARTEQLEIFVNRPLKLYGRPQEDRDAFVKRCHDVADKAADEAAAALRQKYELRMDKVRDTLDEATARAADLAADEEARRRAEQANGVTGLISGLFGGRRSTRALARDAQRAMGGSAGAGGNARRAAAERKLSTLGNQLSDLEQEVVTDILAIEAEWDAKADQVEVLPLRLAKADVSVVNLALVWVPS